MAWDAAIKNSAANDPRIDEDVLRALVDTESAGDPTAVSPKGAQGLAQVMPNTWPEVGEGLDPNNPEDQIEAGRRYLSKKLDETNGNTEAALASYNMGFGAFKQHLESAGYDTSDPEFWNTYSHEMFPEGGYDETRNYVDKIRNRYTAYKQQKLKEGLEAEDQIAAANEARETALDATAAVYSEPKGPDFSGSALGTVDEMREGIRIIAGDPNFKIATTAERIEAFKKLYEQYTGWEPDAQEMLKSTIDYVWGAAGPDEKFPLREHLGTAPYLKNDSEDPDADLEKWSTQAPELLAQKGFAPILLGSQLDEYVKKEAEIEKAAYKYRQRSAAGQAISYGLDFTGEAILGGVKGATDLAGIPFRATGIDSVANALDSVTKDAAIGAAPEFFSEPNEAGYTDREVDALGNVTRYYTPEELKEKQRWFAPGVAQAAGQMLEMAALGGIGKAAKLGKAAVAGLYGGQNVAQVMNDSFTTSRDTLIAEGVPEKEAARRARVGMWYSAPTAFLEAAIEHSILNGAPVWLKELSFTNKAKVRALAAAKGAALEAVGETTQDYSQSVLSDIGAGTSTADITESLKAGVVASVVGGGAGALAADIKQTPRPVPPTQDAHVKARDAYSKTLPVVAGPVIDFDKLLNEKKAQASNSRIYSPYDPNIDIVKALESFSKSPEAQRVVEFKGDLKDIDPHILALFEDTDVTQNKDGTVTLSAKNTYAPRTVDTTNITEINAEISKLIDELKDRSPSQEYLQSLIVLRNTLSRTTEPLTSKQKAALPIVTSLLETRNSLQGELSKIKAGMALKEDPATAALRRREADRVRSEINKINQEIQKYGAPVNRYLKEQAKLKRVNRLIEDLTSPSFKKLAQQRANRLAELMTMRAIGTQETLAAAGEQAAKQAAYPNALRVLHDDGTLLQIVKLPHEGGNKWFVTTETGKAIGVPTQYFADAYAQAKGLDSLHYDAYRATGSLPSAVRIDKETGQVLVDNEAAFVPIGDTLEAAQGEIRKQLRARAAAQYAELQAERAKKPAERFEEVKQEANTLRAKEKHVDTATSEQQSEAFDTDVPLEWLRETVEIAKKSNTFVPDVYKSVKQYVNDLFKGFNISIVKPDGTRVPLSVQVLTATEASKNPRMLIGYAGKVIINNHYAGVKYYNRATDEAYIILDDNLFTEESSDFLAHAVTHEAGHIIKDTLWSNASDETKAEVQKEYERASRSWNAKEGLSLPTEGIEYSKDTANFTPISFGEWFANRVAVWAANPAHKVRNSADTLFKKIGFMLKKLWTRYTKAVKTGAPKLDEWLTNLYTGDTNFGKISSDQHALDFMVDRYNSSKPLDAGNEDIRGYANSRIYSDAYVKAAVQEAATKRTLGDTELETRVKELYFKPDNIEQTIRTAIDETNDLGVDERAVLYVMLGDHLSRQTTIAPDADKQLHSDREIYLDTKAAEFASRYARALSYLSRHSVMSRDATKLKAIKGIKADLQKNPARLASLPANWEQVVRSVVDKHYDTLKAAPAGSYLQLEAMSQTTEDIAKELGLSQQDLIWHFWYGNILSGINTQAVNVLANAANLLLRSISSGMASPRDFLPYINGLLTGLVKGGTEAAAILRGRQLARKSAFKFVSQSLNKKRIRSGNKVVDAVVNTYMKALEVWPFRPLAAMDALFWRSAYEAQATLIAARNVRKDRRAAIEEGIEVDESYGDLLNKVSDALHNSDSEWKTARVQAAAEVQRILGSKHTKNDIEHRAMEIIDSKRNIELYEEAKRYGDLATYQQQPEGIAGSIARVVSQFVDLVPLARPFAPFINIVANVVDSSMDFTPFGAWRAYTGRHITDKHLGYEHNADGSSIKMKDGKPVEKTSFTQLERRQRAMASVLGTTATLVMAALAFKELEKDDPEFMVYGAGPPDKKARDSMKARGWMPYSIRTKINGKDHYFRYNETPLGPVFTMLGALLDAAKYRSNFKRMGDKMSVDKVITAASIAAFGPLQAFADMGFVKSLANIQAVMNEERPVTTLIASPARGFYPYIGLASYVAKYTDPYAMDYTDWKAQVLGGIPVVQSKYVRSMLNALGEPVPVAAADRFWRSEPPSKIWRWTADRDIKIAPLQKVVELGTGDSSREKALIAITSADRQKTLGRYAAGFLTPQEAYDMVKLSGPAIKSRMEQLMLYSDYYDKDTLQKKVDAIVTEERRNAKFQMLLDYARGAKKLKKQ